MVVHHIHFTHVGFMALSGICTFSCEHAACVWITHVVLVTAFPDTVVGMNLKLLPYATLEYFSMFSEFSFMITGFNCFSHQLFHTAEEIICKLTKLFQSVYGQVIPMSQKQDCCSFLFPGLSIEAPSTCCSNLLFGRSSQSEES